MDQFSKQTYVNFIHFVQTNTFLKRFLPSFEAAWGNRSSYARACSFCRTWGALSISVKRVNERWETVFFPEDGLKYILQWACFKIFFCASFLEYKHLIYVIMILRYLSSQLPSISIKIWVFFFCPNIICLYSL